jgi:hypothetical protein
MIAELEVDQAMIARAMSLAAPRLQKRSASPLEVRPHDRDLSRLQKRNNRFEREANGQESTLVRRHRSSIARRKIDRLYQPIPNARRCRVQEGLFREADPLGPAVGFATELRQQFTSSFGERLFAGSKRPYQDCL